jgi:hypothetical protein
MPFSFEDQAVSGADVQIALLGEDGAPDEMYFYRLGSDGI